MAVEVTVQVASYSKRGNSSVSVELDPLCTQASCLGLYVRPHDFGDTDGNGS